MKRHNDRRIIWHDGLHHDTEQRFTDDDGNDVWAVVACYNLPTTGEAMKVKLNGEIVEVQEVVNFDQDDRRVYVKTWTGSEVFCIPFADVVLKDIHPSETVTDAVNWAYGQAEPEAEAQAAEVVRDTEWLGEPTLHDIAITSAEYNVRRAHETGMNIEWAERRLQEEIAKATPRR